MKGHCFLNRKHIFPLIFCVFSLMNLKQIINVLDDENQLVQNRRLFATRGKKLHIVNSCQFCKIKVLRVAVVFEDGVV